MNVWIVYRYDYEASRILAVYDSLEKAEAAVKSMRENFKGVVPLDVDIQTWEVQ